MEELIRRGLRNNISH